MKSKIKRILAEKKGRFKKADWGNIWLIGWWRWLGKKWRYSRANRERPF